MKVVIKVNYELKELNINMRKLGYEMFQDILLIENGSTNLCNGLPYEVFKNYIETQLSRKYQIVNEFDTPTIIYILYVNSIPVGYIGLRLELNESWKKWSGNFYYAIRKSERNKGYGNKILELGNGTKSNCYEA